MMIKPESAAKPLGLLMILVSSILIIGCSSVPKVTQNEVTTGEFMGLYRVDNTEFDEFYIRSSEIFTRYSAINFNTLDVDNIDIDDSHLHFYFRPWELTTQDKARLKRYFDEKVIKVFENDGPFPIQSESVSGRLDVSMTLVEFTPSAPKDDLKYRHFSKKFLTRSVGNLIMNLEIADSNSGEIVAIIKDNRHVGDSHMLERSSQFRTNREFRQTFQLWLNQLEQTLTYLKETAPINEI